MRALPPLPFPFPGCQPCCALHLLAGLPLQLLAPPPKAARAATPLLAGVGAASLVALQAQVARHQQEAQLVREGKLDAEELRARRVLLLVTLDGWRVWR